MTIKLQVCPYCDSNYLAGEEAFKAHLKDKDNEECAKAFGEHLEEIRRDIEISEKLLKEQS